MSSKRVVWRGWLEAWQESGESVSAFCRSRGLDRARFVYWQRVLSAADAADAACDGSPSWVPIVVASGSAVTPDTVPGGIEVVLPNGVRVQMASRHDVATVVALVRGLVAC